MRNRDIYSFFFLIIQPPPRSPLFPYTTLFRSWNTTYCVWASTNLLAWDYIGPAIRTTSGMFIFLDSSATEDEQDRKSTRLNSSHRTISYAVFCLKKKKKTKIKKLN